MDKERLMQFLSDAIDMGCEVHLKYFGEGLTEQQASSLAERMASVTGGSVESSVSKHNEWFTVEGKHTGAFFHKDSLKRSVLAE